MENFLLQLCEFSREKERFKSKDFKIKKLKLYEFFNNKIAAEKVQYVRKNIE